MGQPKILKADSLRLRSGQALTAFGMTTLKVELARPAGRVFIFGEQGSAKKDDGEKSNTRSLDCADHS
jgi:hypothetical protein